MGGVPGDFGDAGAAFEPARDGTIVRVRVRPRSPRDEVLGADGGTLRVAVRAAPERGKANEAVLRTVAAWLGLAPSRLELHRGAASRDKAILVRGETPSDLRKRAGQAGGRRRPATS